MTLLVTGASGTLGSAVCREAIKRGLAVVAYSRDRSRLLNECHNAILETGDVQDCCRVIEVCRHHNVDSVVHCAALKHVGECERHPLLACDTNIGGVRNVLAAIDHEDIRRAVFVSSDKAVDQSVYGMTKLLGERFVIEQALWSGRALNCVRLGNLIGSNGSVLQIWRRAAAEGRPITMHHHQGKTPNRFAMRPWEAARFILGVLAEPDGARVRFRPMPVINMENLRLAAVPDIPVNRQEIGRELLNQIILDASELARTATARDGYAILPSPPLSDWWPHGWPDGLVSTGQVPCLTVEETKAWLQNLDYPPHTVCS